MTLKNRIRIQHKQRPKKRGCTIPTLLEHITKYKNRESRETVCVTRKGIENEVKRENYVRVHA